MADYVYAGTRARALEQELLTESQRELLVGAKSVPEMYQNLTDTFLAPYLSEHDESELSLILEKSIADAREILDAIAPEPALLEILWLRYDFYNLKAIIKSAVAGLPDETITQHCFTIGRYGADRLIAAYHAHQLAIIDTRLEAARAEADNYQQIADIDLVLNLHYLTTIRDIAHKLNNAFATGYVTRLIDLFNLKAALRTHGFTDGNVRDVFVSGGTFHRRELESVDDILAQFPRIGGGPHWKEALDEYRATGSFALIEKASEDYMNWWLKDQSYHIFTLAPLFAYFNAKKNNVQVIRAIYVGKVAGLEEHEIRYNLRNLYQ